MKAMFLGMMMAGQVVFGAAERSGRAEVELVAASETWRPGVPVMAGVRMKLDAGWHTYWVNPGEGGMRVSVEWTLPEGWSAGELQHPVPVRFVSGGLAGFGYKGEVVFPVVLTPPATGGGAAEVKAEVSWLNCDDSACVPGEATVVLGLAAGPGEAGKQAAVIESALAKVPQPLAGAELVVVEDGGILELRVTWPAGSAFDPGMAEVFPATEQVVADGAVIRFEKVGNAWQARVAKSDYAAGKVKELELVLAVAGRTPVLLRWRAR